MWQMYGGKETCGTRGGLVSGGNRVRSRSNNEWREVSRKLRNRRIPNGTYGGVRGQGNYTISLPTRFMFN